MHFRVATAIATVGHIGFLRPAPGTWGSFAGLLLAWPILAQTGLLGLAMASVIVFLVGWRAADAYEAATARHDPKEIVVDEVVGQWLTILLWLGLSNSIAAVDSAVWAQGIGPTLQAIGQAWVELHYQVQDFLTEAPRHADGVIMIALSGLLPFILFRLFDVSKPGFIGRLDRDIAGGLGTMVDDALAGVLAGLVAAVLTVGVGMAILGMVH